MILGVCLLPQVVNAGKTADGDKPFRVISERESLYGWVRVFDHAGKYLRLLASDASTIGAAGIRDGHSRLTYQDIVHLIPLIETGMKRALLIGLGAGHMATVLKQSYNIETDTLEIDPEVADAATRYFGFKPTGISLVGDARYEIRKLKGGYDLIIHDCFTGGFEPSHLLTLETLRQLKNLLSDGGLLAVNFVAFSDSGRNPALASVALTLKRVFPHYTVFASEPNRDFNDFIFLASDRPIDLNSEMLSTSQTLWLKNRIFPVNEQYGTLLTDNSNPLESLQVKKAERYRRFVADWHGTDFMVR